MKINRGEILITRAEWETLATDWPPVVLRQDGSMLAIAGIWSDGKRSYSYASLEVAGLKPWEVGPDAAMEIASARGSDVLEYRHDADPSFDGSRYRSGAKESHISVWWIAPNVPGRLKCGETQRSSGNIPHGTAKVHFLGGPTSAPAYRSASQEFRLAEPAGQPKRSPQR